MEFEPQTQQDPLKHMLGNSLRLRTDDPAPPMPAQLCSDLQAHFAPAQAAPVAAVTSRSWWARVTTAFSHPGWAASAVAVVALGVLGPQFLHPSEPAAESFRGEGGGEVASIPVLLVGGPDSAMLQLTEAGDLEARSLKSLASAEAAAAEGNPKVIVDFTEGRIQAIAADGRVVHESPLPTDASQLSISIADAVSRL
ncbi:hypothetical protein HNR46_001255 [Haloferula luteola]|uniref:Uncharacterized protein n=1 Tax=Haloferula luteola TaxID=595692 RepID=A0A840VDV6_9BACT|nr:hypothetical protein [Haloferula luteola]MBB5351021.1 hypothetical protein [Haloferula luteola]